MLGDGCQGDGLVRPLVGCLGRLGSGVYNPSLYLDLGFSLLKTCGLRVFVVFHTYSFPWDSSPPYSSAGLTP
jgi:hypothetical protein